MLDDDSLEVLRELKAREQWLADGRLNLALQMVGLGDTDWDSLTCCMGRNELPALLSHVWRHIPHDQLLKAVCDAWVSAEFPEPHLPRRQWLNIFRGAGYHDGEQPATPPERVTLWRGGIKRSRMSWTADRAQAEWYRDRFRDMPGSPGPGRLWTVTVGADRLLAHYGGGGDGGRGEDEYVINPTGLRPREVQP
jgi:hypothetical protein